MNTATTIPFQTPPFLTLLCAMAAMTFVVATVRWLRLARRGGQTMSLNSKIWTFQFYNFLNILIVSVLNGWFLQAVSHKTVAEAGILALVLAVAVIVCKIRKMPVMRMVLARGGAMLFLFLACLAGWGATIFLGWCVHMCVALLAGEQAGQYAILVPMVAGMSWVVVVFVFHQRLSPEAKKLCRVRDVLMPVMLAYMVLIVPLFIQDTANSKGWQEMKDRKPPFRRA